MGATGPAGPQGPTGVISFVSHNTTGGELALATSSTDADNTAYGYLALGSNTAGGYNTAVGYYALSSAPTTFNNTAVGFRAATLTTTTGSNNTAVGNGALRFNTTGNANTAVGQSALPKNVAGVSGATTGVNDAVPVVIDSNGQLGTISSSARYKHDIADMTDVSARLMALRSVTFRYNKPFTDSTKPVQFSLVAQEVAQSFPELVVENAAHQPETVKYHLLSTLLLNELQKEHRVNQTQAAQLADLSARVREIDTLKQQVAELLALRAVG